MMVLYLAVLQLALPLAMIAWLSLGRPRSRADLFGRIASAWILLIGIGVAGVWIALPIATVAILASLLALASIVAALRLDGAKQASGNIAFWAGRATMVAAALLGLWAAVPAMAGWGKSEQSVNLQFPFREGRYLIANGGAAERINGHFMTLRPSYKQWRGESYAVDLIRIDRAGFRTKEKRLFALPKDPRAYLTFDTPVHAPCSGAVERAASDRPDMPVPQRDRDHLEGNFVLLRCGSNNVLLGHFRRGQVRAKRGDLVRVGEVIGLVGNSGNTDEPHLHIHAQTPGNAQAPLSGTPLHITFDGRFPVRNMVIPAARRR
jgi:hypothetical protein